MGEQLQSAKYTYNEPERDVTWTVKTTSHGDVELSDTTQVTGDH